MTKFIRLKHTNKNKTKNETDYGFCLVYDKNNFSPFTFISSSQYHNKTQEDEQKQGSKQIQSSCGFSYESNWKTASFLFKFVCIRTVTLNCNRIDRYREQLMTG